jgi:hypothetical protein
MMSVRATGALIGDAVYVTALSNSPDMIVSAIDTDNKLVTAVWFSASHEAQQAVFPASALDRVEVKAPPAKAAATAKTAPAAKTVGRKKK